VGSYFSGPTGGILSFDEGQDFVRAMREEGKQELILEMRGIKKHFPGVIALDGVDFDLRRGEVHALVGENGAGKSTLIKILAGIYSKDAGEIIIDGRRVEINNPHKAQELGLSFIHQELNLISFFNSFENMVLGLRYPRNKLGLINWKAFYREMDSIARLLGIDFSLKKPVRELAASQRRMVMIARAMVRKAKVIVMDESTAGLSQSEIERLFRLINNLKKQKISIIYISHRLEEIFQIADRITVMRDGVKIGTYDVNDINFSQLISLIAGKTLKEKFPKEYVSIGEEIFKVRNLTRSGALEDIDFCLHRGEILGITGLLGSGKSELARVIFGIDQKDCGEIYLNGKQLEMNSPQEAISHGIVLIPEERREQGLVMNMSLKENITLPSLRNFRLWKWLGTLSFKKEVEVTKEFIQALSIHTTGFNQIVRYLSGGNQQKVVLAKWLACNSKIFIFDEPTRGIDVGAKTEIYKLINRLAKRGAGVILLSSEIEEVMGICDRILVLFKGRIIKELKTERTSSEEVLSSCYGR